jgi:hypothetical protein
MAVGVFRSGQIFPGGHHWIPADSKSKYQMLTHLRHSSNRIDIELVPHEDRKHVNRTLSSKFPEISQKLWQLAGYAAVPDIFALIDELLAEQNLGQANGTNGSHY